MLHFLITMISVFTLAHIASTGAILTALILLWKVGAGLFNVARRFYHFLDDWLGTEARNGREAIPGISQRLDSIEHELHPNSGKSLRDTVNRIESAANEALTVSRNTHDKLDDLMQNYDKRIGTLEDNLINKLDDVGLSIPHIAETAVQHQAEEENPEK